MTTDRELAAMAAAASTGESRTPKEGQRASAAMGPANVHAVYHEAVGVILTPILLGRLLEAPAAPRKTPKSAQVMSRLPDSR